MADRTPGRRARNVGVLRLRGRGRDRRRRQLGSWGDWEESGWIPRGVDSVEGAKSRRPLVGGGQRSGVEVDQRFAFYNDRPGEEKVFSCQLFRRRGGGGLRGVRAAAALPGPSDLPPSAQRGRCPAIEARASSHHELSATHALLEWCRGSLLAVPRPSAAQARARVELDPRASHELITTPISTQEAEGGQPARS